MCIYTGRAGSGTDSGIWRTELVFRKSETHKKKKIQEGPK